MPLSRRAMLHTAAAAAATPFLPVRAQPAAPKKPGVIRIGVLTDLSGTYRDSAGPTSVACTQQAVQEAMEAAPGLTVELLQADHFQKPDVALSIARSWFDQDGVDAVTNCNNSAIALAISNLARERDKVHLNTGAATVELTGKSCSPNNVHWTFDTWEIAHSSGVAAVKAGGTKWFLVAADYAFGHAMQADLSHWVQQAGGAIMGTAFYPFPGTSDFSSYMLQAQTSGANVVGFLNSGGDFINCVKQASEFGLRPPEMRVAGTASYITDIHSLGLPVAQGLTYTECFYWDLNPRTRAFLNRVKHRTPDNYPNQIHAGDYAATFHYLKTVNQIGVARAKASGLDTVNAMKAIPTDDDAYGPGRIRIDGRHVHPAYLFQAKRPEESGGEWDLLKLVSTIPTDAAFRPLSDGNCPLVKA